MFHIDSYLLQYVCKSTNPCTTERTSHKHNVDSTTRPIHSNVITNDSKTRSEPLLMIFVTYTIKTQNDDWFMHAITCLDELQHGSLIRTREPMDDEHWTSGMPANDIDRGGPQPLVAAEGKHQHLLLLLLTSLLILLIGITRGENCELRERRF